MTEDLIAMAIEADPMGKDGRLYFMAILTPETIDNFAALIEARAVARTREECAVRANEFLTAGRSPLGVRTAAAIRALGERT